METAKVKSESSCHVLALPYPGRGHINPMMNLCKLLAIKKPDIVISFVVTEEWEGILRSEIYPENIIFVTIPNCIPSEIGRGNDFPGFVEAVSTKMEAPFQKLLDGLELPVSVIVCDTELIWVPDVGNRRNIPVASLWTMSASVFTVLHHFDLLEKNGHFPANLSERGQEVVDYIPGLPPTRLVDLPAFFSGIGRKFLDTDRQAVCSVSKVQYLLFTSFYELDALAIDVLSLSFAFPLYVVGPTIPHFQLEHNDQALEYLEWLDRQPEGSVLYVSMGSFVSVSGAQMEEIAAGLRDSGVRLFLVSRKGTIPFEDESNGMGIAVPWCDQLRVLCHPAVGGFWTHCGWNSTLEGVFAGKPMLTFPIFWDQFPNSKKIVEDLRIGWRVKRPEGYNNIVNAEEIANTVKTFMDDEVDEIKEMRERARKLGEVCQEAVSEGGSSCRNLEGFLRDISSNNSTNLTDGFISNYDQLNES